MRVLFRIAAVVAVFLAETGSARAQVVLLGITASLTGQPQTTGRLVDVDPATGAATNPRDTGLYGLTGITTQPTTGFLFGLTSSSSTPANSLVRIDPLTGTPFVVGPTGLSQIIEGDLAFNPVNGFLYGVQDLANISARNLFRIDPATGAATTIGNITPAGDFSALAFSPSGVLYAINTDGSANSLLNVIDPSTATISSTMPLNVNLSVQAGMAIAAAGNTAYVTDGGDGGPTGQLFSLDLSNGVLTPIGSLGLTEGLSGLTVVPEPSSFALGGLVLLPVVMRWVRRKREVDACSSI
jgi:hypothetical protein